MWPDANCVGFQGSGGNCKSCISDRRPSTANGRTWACTCRPSQSKYANTPANQHYTRNNNNAGSVQYRDSRKCKANYNSLSTVFWHFCSMPRTAPPSTVFLQFNCGYGICAVKELTAQLAAGSKGKAAREVNRELRAETFQTHFSDPLFGVPEGFFSNQAPKTTSLMIGVKLC